MDTLSENLFYQLSGSHKFLDVMESIHTALEEGFKIKINMVVLKGINEVEIPEFIQYFLKNSVEVRFIEFIPLCGLGWREEYFFPYEEILKMIPRSYDLCPLPSSGVAREFVLRNGNGMEGKIGVIAAVTRSFCSSCSRMRLSANGELMPCLFSRTKVELLPIWRDDFSPGDRAAKIKEAFKQAVNMKPMCMPKNHAVNDVYIRRLGG